MTVPITVRRKPRTTSLLARAPAEHTRASDGCAQMPRPGHVIEGPTTKVRPTTTMNGFTHHPQDETLLQGFVRGPPSSALHGRFSCPNETALPTAPTFPERGRRVVQARSRFQIRSQGARLMWGEPRCVHFTADLRPPCLVLHTLRVLVWILLSLGVVAIFAVTYAQRRRGRRWR